MFAPFHLPSQQTQVNPAHQVHLEPPGGHDPQWDQARLIFPETHKSLDYTSTDRYEKHGLKRSQSRSPVAPQHLLVPAAPFFLGIPALTKKDG